MNKEKEKENLDSVSIFHIYRKFYIYNFIFGVYLSNLGHTHFSKDTLCLPCDWPPVKKM